jgi:hypothetical protein
MTSVVTVIQFVHKRILQFRKLTRNINNTEHTESLFPPATPSLKLAPRDPSVSMRSELLVMHEKLGQLPLLTAYVAPV